MLPMLCLAVLVLVVLVWKRLWWRAGLATVLLVWIGVQVLHYLVPTKVEGPEGRETFRFLLLNLLRDSGRWRGWAPTWNPGISWLRLPIDHCLLSDEIGVARRAIGPEIGSDHRGLEVEVFFR